MKSNKNKKKKLLAAAAALALIAAVAGTFAWLTDQDAKVNRIESAADTTGGVEIVEDWEPTNPGPDVTMKKDIKVTNTKGTPVFVRVSWEEVIKTLVSRGTISPLTTGYSVPGTPSLTDNVPVQPNFDPAGLAALGYTDIGAKFTTALPTNVKVFAKGTSKKNAITGDVTTTIDYKYYYEYATGLYQAITLDVDFAAPVTNDAETEQNWSYKFTTLTYSTYVGGFEHTTSAWAKSSMMGADGVNPASGYALLGGTGVAADYNENFDYKASTLGANSQYQPAIPSPAAPGFTNQTLAKSPTGVADESRPSQVEDLITAVTGKTNAIELVYNGGNITTTAALAANKWVYNADDGWFYYLTVLDSTTTTSTSLFDHIYFNTNFDDTYKLMTYDLNVKMEAVQATKAAITGSGSQWNMAAGPILTFLEGIARN